MRHERLGPVFGAELTNVDLSTMTASNGFDEINDLINQHEVLVIRGQRLNAEEQLTFGRLFGELAISPFSPRAATQPELIVLETDAQSKRPLTDIWHADETYKLEPPKLTILKALISPRLGGDTVFCSMRAAFDFLSDRMKSYLIGLTALHGFGRFRDLLETDLSTLHKIEGQFPRANHPVVTLHPETSATVLYVNRHFTERINELPDEESRSILDFLLQQTARPEIQLRIKWEPGTVVIWDNRSVQHYAPPDYWPQRRRMERVTVEGLAPVPASTDNRVIHHRIEVDDVPAELSEEGALVARNYEFNKAGLDDPDPGG
jgi:taurine dioxygenase